jgi:ASC-1-like (ASCH) protein
MIHELKIRREYFDDVESGRKPFEIRKNDRDFCEGDYLLLCEIDEGAYTGRDIVAKITYVLDDPEFVKDGYVVLGIDVAFFRHG